jgi:hypothetical protein
MFRFGLREALAFLALLLPLAGALAGLLMAMAIRCKTFKEAQANATVVVLGVSLLPMVTLFNQDGESALAPVGAGAGAGHADGPRAQGRADGRVDLALPPWHASVRCWPCALCVHVQFSTAACK